MFVFVFCVQIVSVTLGDANISPDILQFSGEFERSRYHGEGTLVYSDKTQFDGLFFKNKPISGVGTLKDKHNQIIFLGVLKSNMSFNPKTNTYEKPLPRTVALTPPTFAAVSNEADMTAVEEGPDIGTRLTESKAGALSDITTATRSSTVSTNPAPGTPAATTPKTRTARRVIPKPSKGKNKGQASAKVCIYEGEFNKMGKLHGEGRFIDNANTIFSGTFDNGVLNNPCTITYKDGTVYTGSHARYAKQGNGELRSKDGTVYSGSFREDEFNGPGTLTYSDGQELKGVFYDGMIFEGEGTLKGHNNTSMTGKCESEKDMNHEFR